MRGNFYFVFMSLAFLFMGLFFGFGFGEYRGNVDVASGRVVCQQALGEWICKPVDEVKR